MKSKIIELKEAGYTNQQLVDAFSDGAWLGAEGYTQVEAEEAHAILRGVPGRLEEVAGDWLREFNEDGNFLAELEKNRGNTGACYTGTRYWAEGEAFTSSELEAEIERQVGWDE
jgi:hypothetical protein